MAIIKPKPKQKQKKNECWQGYEEIGTPCATVETVWWFLKKLITELLFNRAIPLLGNIQKDESRDSNRLFVHPCS